MNQTRANFKMRRLHIYLLTVLQIFFIKLVSEHATVNLILIHNTKRQEVFSVSY